MSIRKRLTWCMGFVLSCAVLVPLRAQSVQPLIAEYIDHATGSFDVTNSSYLPSVVQLDPKSFSISEDGTGQFRSLDASIHIELSATSLRLAPRETAHVFYKVTADRVPAWLCIYASFSSLKASPGINVRMLLPHTIYIYQKPPLQKAAMELTNLKFDPLARVITAEVTNTSEWAGRAASVEVKGEHAVTSEGGFPVLPHEKRVLSIAWKSEQRPRDLSIEFDHFVLKQTIAY